MFVTTATVGESFRKVPSLSSASATRNSPCPSFALEPRLFSFPPTTAVGSQPAVASTVTGMFYLAAAAWSARRLGRQPGERLLLYALLAGAAAWQLYAGYVECYAQLAVCLLLFATTLLQHERGEATLTLPAIWFAAALFWHLNALFLANRWEIA